MHKLSYTYLVYLLYSILHDPNLSNALFVFVSSYCALIWLFFKHIFFKVVHPILKCGQEIMHIMKTKYFSFLYYIQENAPIQKWMFFVAQLRHSSEIRGLCLMMNWPKQENVFFILFYFIILPFFSFFP